MVKARLSKFPGGLNWGVEIEPLGAGEEFATNPCDKGVDTMLWHFATGEAAKFFTEQQFIPAQKTSGGNFQTDFSFHPDAAIYNNMESSEDEDEGVLIGMHVCVAERPDSVHADVEKVTDDVLEDRVFIMDSRWDGSFPSFKFEGDLKAAQTVGYAVAREWGVSEQAPTTEEVLTPLEELGIDTSSQAKTPAPPQPDGDQGQPSETPETEDEGDQSPSVPGDVESTGVSRQEPTGSEGKAEGGGDKKPTGTASKQPSGSATGAQRGRSGDGSTTSRKPPDTTAESGSGSDAQGEDFNFRSNVAVGKTDKLDVNVYRLESSDEGADRVEVGIDAPLDPEEFADEFEQELENLLDEAMGGKQPERQETAQTGGPVERQEPSKPDTTTESANVSDVKSTDDSLQEIADEYFGEGSDKQDQQEEESDDPQPEDIVDAYEKAVSKWDLSSYTDFSSSCLSEYDATVCGEVWQQLKDEDLTG